MLSKKSLLLLLGALTWLLLLSSSTNALPTGVALVARSPADKQQASTKASTQSPGKKTEKKPNKNPNKQPSKQPKKLLTRPKILFFSSRLKDGFHPTT
jgi:hypothetical protein